MTIIDKDDCLTLNRVTLLLTIDEAKSLQSQLGELISKPKIRDVHIGNMNSDGEISVAIYTETSISRYDEPPHIVYEKETTASQRDTRGDENNPLSSPLLTPPSPSLPKRGIRGGVGDKGELRVTLGMGEFSWKK